MWSCNPSNSPVKAVEPLVIHPACWEKQTSGLWIFPFPRNLFLKQEKKQGGRKERRGRKITLQRFFLKNNNNPEHISKIWVEEESIKEPVFFKKIWFLSKPSFCSLYDHFDGSSPRKKMLFAAPLTSFHVFECLFAWGYVDPGIILGSHYPQYLITN